MFGVANLNNINSLGTAERPDFWYESPTYALNSVMPSFIHDYTQNKYWNSSAGAGGFPWTTVRTSNATTVDTQGRVAWAPHQLCTRGQTIDSWSVSSDGNITLSGNTAPTGSPSYNVTWTVASPTNGCILGGQTAIVSGNMTYSIYARYVNHDWIRVVMYSSANTSNQVRCWVNLQTKTIGTAVGGGTATIVSASVEDVGNDWVRVTITGNASWTTSLDGNLLIATASSDNSATRVGNGATIEVASAILENYGAQSPQAWRPEFATTGSAKYCERIEYDWQTGIIRGLKVEAAQTNVIANSAIATSGLYTNFSTSTSDAPDIWGFKSVTITSVGGGLQNYAYVTGAGLSATAGNTYSVSAFVKRGTSQFVQLTTSANYNTPSSTAPYINYDFDTDTIASGGTNLIASSAYREILADGWVRLCISFTANATASGSSCIIGIVDSLASTRLQATTNTGTVRTFGHQTEAQTQVTSYVPTFTTSATRAADLTVVNPIPWYNQLEGTVMVRGIPPNADTVNNRRVVTFNDGTTSNRYDNGRNTSNKMNLVATIGGVSNFNPSTANSANDFTLFKTIMTYTTSLRRVVLNGGAIASNATVGPSSGLTQMTIGHIAGLANGNSFNGWIQEVIYWPAGTASDADIQAKTTL